MVTPEMLLFLAGKMGLPNPCIINGGRESPIAWTAGSEFNPAADDAQFGRDGEEVNNHNIHIDKNNPLYRAIGMAGKRCTFMYCWQDAARTIPANIGDPVAVVDWDDGEPCMVANPDTDYPTLCADERGCYVEIKGDQYLVSVDSALDEAVKNFPVWKTTTALSENDIRQIEALYALCWFFSQEERRH